ncbi:hypothetical protein NDU88_007611 [Pleurodeles waltl]|uniref:Uncharacterized protein n=1 Tax=Pleurodeles waltl TaxID=8319 RepID=A0AAV7NWS3_PLEWA|nr:hypothetical protein NDU88_007611 [Pleurodeles waltl]
MKHQEGGVNETSTMAGQQLVDENKTPMDTNYFTRARLGAGEGDEEGDSIILLDNRASQAPATMLCLTLEHITVPRLTQTEYKREYRQELEQELDSTRGITSFGMGSSINEELAVFGRMSAGTASTVKTMTKTTTRNVPCGGTKRSNLYPVSPEYELEESGPASIRWIVNLEPGKTMMESPSGNNRVIVVETHQQPQPQIEVVQANESTDKGRACSTLLHGLMKASQKWPTILEQDDWPLREISMGALSTEEGTKKPKEEKPLQNNTHKDRGDVLRPEFIKEAINASLLAAVKALTWQSHTMEIHLELTHMLA